MSIAKYVQVKEKIKYWILMGKFAPNQKILSENELVVEFQVSRHTIRQAIGELVNEGWLYREQGRGTFCANRTNTTQQKSNKLIGMITTYISEYIFPSIIRGAESYLNQHGYTLLLASTNNNPREEAMCLQNILSKQVDGLIVEPTKSALYNPNLDFYFSLEEKKIPYLMLNAFYPQLQPLSLTMDDKLGGFLATEHLIRLGHKKIIGLFKADDMQGTHRMQGYVQAHRQYGLSVQPGMVITFSTEERFAKLKLELKQLLHRKVEIPTAIVCYNDEVAVAILDVMRELNLRIPSDISLVGYDNSYLAEATEVKLTTIQHPQSLMGEAAAKLVIEAIEKRSEESSSLSSIVFKPKLIVRSSTTSIGESNE